MFRSTRRSLDFMVWRSLRFGPFRYAEWTFSLTQPRRVMQRSDMGQPTFSTRPADAPSFAWGRPGHVGVEVFAKVPPRCHRFYPKGRCQRQVVGDNG
jgi:hypothetical protein